MVDGKVIKRAKHKSTIKDPGTPGILEMVNSFIKPLHMYWLIHDSVSPYILPGTNTHSHIRMCICVWRFMCVYDFSLWVNLRDCQFRKWWQWHCCAKWRIASLALNLLLFGIDNNFRVPNRHPGTGTCANRIMQKRERGVQKMEIDWRDFWRGVHTKRGVPFTIDR